MIHNHAGGQKIKALMNNVRREMKRESTMPKRGQVRKSDTPEGNLSDPCRGFVNTPMKSRILHTQM